MLKKIINFFVLPCLSSLIFFNASAYAVSYSLAQTWSDDPYMLYDNFDYHWDDWCVEWDAEAQQSKSFMPSGNAPSMHPGPFRIISDSGVAGEKVTVSMTFEMTSNIAFGESVLYSSPIGNEENFAGFDNFDAWIDYQFGVNDQIWSYSANTTDPWADVNEVQTITMQTDLFTYADYDIRMEVSHGMISASGMQAYDPGEDFAVLYGLNGYLSLTDISVAPISADEGNSLLFLVLGFAGLVCLRKSMPLKGIS